jgi:hypothetical protein
MALVNLISYTYMPVSYNIKYVLQIVTLLFSLTLMMEDHILSSTIKTNIAYPLSSSF